MLKPAMNKQRFLRAIELIDQANSRDPKQQALVYAEQMSGWLERLAPDASEELRLAARGQHICRWMVPRDRYPNTREGYLRWRSHMYRFHAEKMREILLKAGYAGEAIEKVAAIVMKKGMARDPEVQLVEDSACLVFLEFQFADFAKHHPEEKLIAIVQKTWRKMSTKAHQFALALKFPPEVQAVVQKALN